MKAAFFNISFRLGLDRLFDRLYRRSPVVLAFHGVTGETPGSIYNYEGSHLHLPVFETLVGHLARRYRIVPLDRIASWLAGGERPPDGAVAITFDDGYRNVLTRAAPVLRDHGAPATVFVTTDFVVRGRMLWPDRLLAALALTSRRSLEYTLGDATAVLPLDSDAGKIRACERLRAECKSLPDADRRALVDEIVSRLGVDETSLPGASDDFRPLDTGDLRELARYGITIGSHTRTHPVLARCSRERLESELVESRRAIEKMTGARCDSFAYPNGARGDFDRRTREAVIAAGYRCAATTVKQRVTRETDRFEIPRYILAHNRIRLSEFAVEVSGFPTFLRSVRGKLSSR